MKSSTWYCTTVNLLLPIALGTGLALVALGHSIPLGGFVGTAEQIEVTTELRDSATPKWADVEPGAFPGCSADTTGLGDKVVETHTGQHERWTFDQAWAVANDDNPATEAWVVGGCR